MADLKLGSTSTAATPKSSFIIQPTKARKVIPVRKLSDPEGGFVKIMSYGHSGSGKTFAIIGFLLAGLKVLVLCTDVGGEGLTAVRTGLRELGRLDLMDNLYFIELPEYEDVSAFVLDPGRYMDDIYDIGLNMLVWDGFTGFQQFQLSEYIAEQEAYRGDVERPVSDARNSGLWFERTDWGQVRNGTIRNLSRFLYLHNAKTGEKWHKYLTCLEAGKAKEDQLTGKPQKGPLIQGAAASMMGPAFDLIIECNVVEAKDPNGTPEYQYRTVGNSNLLAKSRGIKLNPIEKADMYAIWQKITQQLGIKVVGA